MDILAYGEDALTLWALEEKLPDVLNSLDDPTDLDSCQAFYRPSFGRRGDLGGFGEFDFILLTDVSVYLGESKWDRLTGRVAPSVFSLKPVQIRRHTLMRFYIKEWAYGDYNDWADFVELGRPKLAQLGINKPIAPADSDLRTNLEQVLGVIRQKYYEIPTVRNVFLLLHRGVKSDKIPARAGGDFKVISIDCSQHLDGNYIRLGS